MLLHAFQRSFIPLTFLLLAQLGLVGQVVINEVYPDNVVVELKNLGTSNVDVANYWICQFPAYYEVQAQTALCGDTDLEPGEILSVQIDNSSLQNVDGEVGLYTRRAFGDPTAIVDYMEWGFAGHQRASVAITAGIWSSDTFATAPTAGQSLAYDGDGDTGTDFAAGTPTICQDNRIIRILAIDTDNETITLKNFGSFTTDLASYQFCIGFGQYNILSGYSGIKGNLNLAPDETVTFDLTTGQNVNALPEVGGLSFFSTNVFGSSDPNILLDFVQWGAGNQHRVAQAVTAGRWPDAEEFVDGVSPYTYVGDADDVGAVFWNGTNAPAIIRIIAVDTDNESVTLQNFGESAQNIADYQFCIGFGQYNILSGYTGIDGNLDLAPNETVTFDLTTGQNVIVLPDTGALSLFSTNVFGSSDPTILLDFVQWGAGGQHRVAQGVAAGRWDAESSFVPGVSPYNYVGGANDVGAEFWNGSVAGDAIIRILTVDTDQETVTLKNFGSSSEDISSYQFCIGFGQYNILSGYTGVSGSLTLDPNATVTFDLTTGQNVSALPDTGALSLFLTNSFRTSNPDTLLDFVQWGAGNQHRVAQGVAAGRWPDAAEFVAGATPFTYVGDADDIGARFWVDNTFIRMSQIIPEIDWVTLKNFDGVSRDISGYFFCTQAWIYPQLGNSNQVSIVNGDLILAPGEEVTVKVLTPGGVLDTGSIFLFSTNVLGFNNQNPFVTRDIAQRGDPNGYRVDNAVAVGRWDDAAAFIAGASPFDYIGNATDVGSSFWQGVLDCPAQAGTLTADADTFFIIDGNAFATATLDGNQVIPAGFEIAFVLTSGRRDLIKIVGDEPRLKFRRPGDVKLHLIVFDPDPNSADFFDINEFRGKPIADAEAAIQNRGVCADLDLTGTPTVIARGPEAPCDAVAGTVIATATPVSLINGEAFLAGTPAGDAVIPSGFSLTFILSRDFPGRSGQLEQIGNGPFRVTEPGTYRIHALVFDPTTLDTSKINLGVSNSTIETLTNFLLNRDICAKVDQQGATIEVRGQSSMRLAILDQLQVSPNPTTRKLTVAHPEGLQVSYRLSNLSGQIIAQGAWDFRSGGLQLDLGNQPAGIYQLSIQEAASGATQIKKIVRQ